MKALQLYTHTHTHTHTHTDSFSEIIKYFRKRKKSIINEGSKEQLPLNKRGQAAITLVALVVTVVVLIILAGVSINLIIGNNGIIEKGRIAKESQELAKYKENMSMFIQEKYMENAEFSASTITAYKNKVYYNTKNSDSEETIEEILGNVSSNYIEKLEIIKGELYINTTNDVEKAAASKAEIKVNGLEISNGELKASDKNLDLKDSDGTLLIPPSVTKIGAGAFSSVENLKKIVVPGTVEEIGANAFSNNNMIEEVIIEDGVKKVGDSAFEGCTSLKQVEFPDSIESLGNNVMQSCTKLSQIRLPNKITELGTYFFANCTSLEKVELPSNLEKIGSYVFVRCPIKEITFPNKLREIGSGVFWNIKSLEKINIDEVNEYFKFENGLLLSKDKTKVYFALTSLSNINIPETVTTIVADSFNGSEATSIYVPNGVTELTGTTFGGMSNLKEIKIKADNLNYKTENGNLYSKDGTVLIMYLQEGDVINIPEGVKTITNKATKSIKANTIKLPSTLETLEGWGLSAIYGVSSIEIPENVKPFDARVFGRDVKKIKVSEKNKNIKSVNDTMILSKDGKTLYAIALGVNEFNIPNTVEIIEEFSFYMDRNIKNIDLPASVKEIKKLAFAYSSLGKITIPESTEKIERGVFESCSKLTSIIINKKAGSIAGSPWSCPIAERAVKWLK